ncbi:MAG: gliding motility-associated C-terminal domain-containing protein, partial [Flavobacteriales bacterium]
YNDVCNQATTQTIIVHVDTLEVSVIPPLINCINDSPNAVANLNLSLAPVSYTWTLNGSNISGSGSSVQISEPGEYSVTASYANQCIDAFDFTVDIDTTTFPVSTPDTGVITCVNNPSVILASGPPSNANFQWFLNGAPISGANASSYNATTPGNYSIQVVHPVSGCISNSATNITQDLNVPFVAGGPQDSLTCVFTVIPFENISISGSEDYNVQWSTTDGQLEGLTNSLNAYAAAEGTYEITVTDISSGCSASAFVDVFQAANYELDLSDLRMPNIISPNGDSKNERWIPFIPNKPELDLSGVFESFDVLVYDRWGKLVHESKSVSDAFQATEQPDGIYYYIVHYTSACGENTDETIQGYVHVQR